MNQYVKRLCLFLPVLAFVGVLIFSTLIFGSQDIAATSNAPANIALKPSTKYSASSIEGVEGNRNVKVISSSLFTNFIQTAKSHSRKRKMNDLTKDPETNSMQTLVNTWTNGSFSPVHKHNDYSEAFVILEGALAFFTFDDNGLTKCTVLDSDGSDRVIIVEKGTWHAMTAAPPSLGYPGHAVIFETSGHVFDTSKATKILAPFAPMYGDGMDGDPKYFADILKVCPRNS